MEIPDGYFRHILLYYFRKGKNAVQARKKLYDAYGEIVDCVISENSRLFGSSRDVLEMSSSSEGALTIHSFPKDRGSFRNSQLCLHKSRTLLFITKSRKVVFHGSLKNGAFRVGETIPPKISFNKSACNIPFLKTSFIPPPPLAAIFSLYLCQTSVASTITKCSKIDKKGTFRNASSQPL